jgi:hypothetical protein
MIACNIHRLCGATFNYGQQRQVTIFITTRSSRRAVGAFERRNMCYVVFHEA